MRNVFILFYFILLKISCDIFRECAFSKKVGSKSKFDRGETEVPTDNEPLKSRFNSRAAAAKIERMHCSKIFSLITSHLLKSRFADLHTQANLRTSFIRSTTGRTTEKLGEVR